MDILVSQIELYNRGVAAFGDFSVLGIRVFKLPLVRLVHKLLEWLAEFFSECLWYIHNWVWPSLCILPHHRV